MNLSSGNEHSLACLIGLIRAICARLCLDLSDKETLNKQSAPQSFSQQDLGVVGLYRCV